MSAPAASAMTARATSSAHSMPSTSKQPQVYQIDFTAVASGKRIAATKRRVRWRFGFANPDALAAGETGTACRGEEHDVTLVWSITSGKRLILADGQEVHYSSSRSGTLEFSWTMRGNHVLKVKAYASPPMSANPGFRQYDFSVDGQSFFNFPKVFRLGLAPNDRGGSPQGAVRLADRGRNYASSGNSMRSAGGGVNVKNVEAPSNRDEEEAYLQEAIRQSKEEEKKSAAKKKAGGGDLLDFSGGGATPAPAFAALPPSSQPAVAEPDTFSVAGSLAAGDLFAAHGSGSVPAPAGSYTAPTSQFALPTNAPQPAAAPLAALPPSTSATNGYNHSFSAPAPANNPFAGGAPAPVAAPYPAPAATANGYGAPAPVTAQEKPAPVTAQPYTAAPQHTTPAAAFRGSFSDGPPAAIPGTPQALPTPSTIGTAPTPQNFPGFSPPPSQAEQVVSPQPPAPEPAAAAPVDPALVSMDTLSGQNSQGLVDSNATAASKNLAEDAYSKLVNMDTFSLVSAKDEDRVNPFEAPASTTVGGTGSLADMKAKNSTKAAPSKSIMNSNNALVVSSNQTSSYGSQYGVQPMQQTGAYGAQPAFGQQQPQYGQHPQYGQQAPAYGQQNPSAQPQQQAPPQTFGQQPAFGQQLPYPPPQQQPAQQYGQAPGYTY